MSLDDGADGVGQIGAVASRRKRGIASRRKPIAEDEGLDTEP